MNFLRVFAILLLLFNSTGAIFGGWSLIQDPTGSDLKIPVTYLEHSPFKDFLVPGIILITVNGVFSLVTMIWTLFRWRNYTRALLVQGALSTGWIIGQMILLKEIYYLQFIFGGIGVVVLLTGLILRKKGNG